MEIVIERRAEIAFRSLEKSEQNEIKTILRRISLLTLNELSQINNLRRLKNTLSDERLYEYRVFRGNQRLSLVCSVQKDKCIIEDILASDKLKRLLLNRRQR